MYIFVISKLQSKWALATVERGDHSPAELGRNLTFAEGTFLYSINSDAPTADSPSFICFNGNFTTIFNYR